MGNIDGIICMQAAVRSLLLETENKKGGKEGAKQREGKAEERLALASIRYLAMNGTLCMQSANQHGPCHFHCRCNAISFECFVMH